MSKALPKDEENAEIYVGKIRERASATNVNLRELKDMRQSEIDSLKDEAQLIQWRSFVEDYKSGRGSSREKNLIEAIFKGRSAEELDKFLENLTPDKLENLKRLAQAVDPLATAMAQPSSSSSSRDDLLLKYLLEQKDKGVETILATIRLMKELQPPAPAPQPQQQVQPRNTLTETLEVVKTINDMARPRDEALDKAKNQIWEMKLKEMEARMPADPVEQVKYIREMVKELGLGGGKTEMDLRMEQMRQDREVDMKKLEWEQKKYELEQDADVAKWEQIGKILQGPVGQAIQNMGNAGADRVRGRGGNKAPPANMPKPVQTQCPNCNSLIYVDSGADTAICGHCGAVLQKSANTQPPRQSAHPTHVEETPEPEEPTEEVEEEEGETQDESTEETESAEGREE